MVSLALMAKKNVSQICTISTLASVSLSLVTSLSKSVSSH